MSDGFFERLRSGDDTVLRDIDRGYRDMTVGALKSAFRDLRIKDLDDCFNDALIDLWDYRGKLDEKKGKLKSLLFTITKRRALDSRSGESVRPPTVNLEDWSGVAGQVSRLEENGVRTEDPELQRLLDATLTVLDSLDPRFATILRMDASGEGVAKSEDVSQETEIPAKQVPVYRSRARRAFERGLRELGVLPPDRKGGCSGN